MMLLCNFDMFDNIELSAVTGAARQLFTVSYIL